MTVVLNRSAIAALGGEDSRRALESVARQVADRARSSAPRRSGALAESIGYEVDRDGAELVARVSWSRDAFYGLFVELGTSRMSAQPFLRPALDGTYTP